MRVVVPSRCPVKCCCSYIWPPCPLMLICQCVLLFLMIINVYRYFKDVLLFLIIK